MPMGTPAPDAVKRLVDRFDQNRDAYLSGSYNEMQLRREFIDPFFEALGWDVYHGKDRNPSHHRMVDGRPPFPPVSSKQ